MRIEPKKIYAVVTGDVVGSSRLDQTRRRDLHEAMSRASTNLQRAFGLPSPVDIFRGDEWQLLVARAELALRVSLFYRASLRAAMESHRFDTRMAIALGTIDFIPGDRVSQGDGEAYRLSGAELESMGKRCGIRFRYPAHPQDEALGVMVQLVDAIASRWSDRQALAVTGALQGWKQDRIATEIWEEPITQQAVAQHLDRASWSHVEVALKYVEETVAAEIAR